ncbi:MAG: T9SS type A sorting domain-containing protein [Chryseolinea sp.]
MTVRANSLTSVMLVVRNTITSQNMLPHTLHFYARVFYASFLFSLIIATCASAQDYELHRTWSLGQSGGLTDRLGWDPKKTLAVHKSGNYFAEAHLTGYPYDTGHASGDVDFYDRTTARRWRKSIAEWTRSDPRAQQIPRAIAFSEVSGDDALYVLIEELTSTDKRARLIKYSIDGDVFWTRLIEIQIDPRILLVSRGGAVIVGGVTSDHMFLKQYSSTGEEGWSSTLSSPTGVTGEIPDPKAIVEATTGDQFYVTGANTQDAFSGGYFNPSSLFVASFTLSSGELIWNQTASFQSPGDCCLRGRGDDIEPVSDGVVVLGQLGGHRETLNAQVTLIKYDQATGNPRWNITHDSDFRDVFDFRRNNLSADGSDLYMTYTSLSGSLTVERIHDEGTTAVPVWARTTWPSPVIDIHSLTFSPHTRQIYLGAHIGMPYNQSQVLVLSPDNILEASGPMREGTKITELQIVREPDLVAHPSDANAIFSRGQTDDEHRFIFLERYELERLFPPFPGSLEAIDHLSSDVLDENSWRVEAICGEQPCADLTMEAHALQSGKIIWSQEFSKPTEIKLIKSDQSTTYGLQLKVEKTYQEVITMDESLFSAGVRGVSIRTNTKDQTLTVKSSTDGQSVPFILALQNEQGKTIKQYDISGPDQKVITDHPDEHVARLMLFAPNPLELSFYPNPSAGEFTVMTTNQKNPKTTISVFNMNGHKIYHDSIPTGGKLLVKLPFVKPGLYILLAKSGAYEKRQLIEVKY